MSVTFRNSLRHNLIWKRLTVNLFQASLRMFTDLDLINRFNIDYFTLCRYLQLLQPLTTARSSRYLVFSGGSVPSVVITGVLPTTTGDMLSTSVRYLVEPQHPFSPFTSNLVDVLDHH